jgi:hypothetical protein
MINIFGHQAVLDGDNAFITIIVDGGVQHTIRQGSLNFAKAVDFYIAQNWEELINVISPENYIKKLYAKYEQIEVKDGNVYVNDVAIHTLDGQRIIECLAKGADVTHIFKFVIRLQNNPSRRAVQELYKFLEHKNLGISVNGNLIAYKAVRNNYTDKHTGSFDNSIGNVLEMSRNQVDDDKDNGCSYGFHAGSLKYATEFASGNDRVVLVEIDPADVVSIPTDCEFQKLRTCKYKVISEFERPLEEHIAYESSLDNDDLDWDDDDSDICTGCKMKYKSWCCDCEQCGDCCECDDCPQDDEELEDAYPDSPKTEIQLELNLDNKMTSNWADARFQYLVMLPWLYAHRRPALGNALKDFYKDIADHHKINPIFALLKKFTSDEDAYKIYKEYTNSK